jgi:PPOX class probable F420-dependent enzyme
VDEISRLGAEKYVLLTTFRKDGRAVPTAVWAAPDGGSLVIWTVADSGKVKRIRRSGEVRLAPCTARGVATGDEVAGHAALLDAAGTERTRGLLAGKYGLVGRVAMLASKLRRGADGTVGIRVTVDTVV